MTAHTGYYVTGDAAAHNALERPVIATYNTTNNATVPAWKRAQDAHIEASLEREYQEWLATNEHTPDCPAYEYYADCTCGADDEPHVGHFTHFGGTWFCDTCNSPYCELA